MTQIKDIVSQLESLAPLAYAEDFDNVGLLVGDKEALVTGILVTHDALEAVVDEAIASNCNLIVSFHPIVFSGIKRFNGQDYVNRVIIKAIKHDIAIYATHTALDSVQHGVNGTICNALGLKNTTTLVPKKDFIYKLTTYAPASDVEHIKQALFSAGAGNIGNYEECSFTVNGTGSFKGNEQSNPVKGTKNVLEVDDEVQINVTFEKYRERSVVTALFDAHPYEEVAYEIITLNNTHQNLGMGMIGELAEPMNEADFLAMLKDSMNVSCIKHSHLLGKNIQKVAVLGGSGSFAISDAKRQQADAFVTADMKYHDFYQAENSIVLCDIGHYESEQFTKNLLHSFLSEHNPQFAVILSQVDTNPVQYYSELNSL